MKGAVERLRSKISSLNVGGPFDKNRAKNRAAYFQCFIHCQANALPSGRLIVEPLSPMAGQHEVAALASYAKSYQTAAALGMTLRNAFPSEAVSTRTGAPQ
jgi:hypothetical protein